MSREPAVGFASYKVSLGSDEELRRQLGTLCVHWKCFTAEMQSHLNIVLKKMYREGKLTSKNSPVALLEDLLSSREDDEPVNEERIKITENLMTAFRSLLKINNLGTYLLKELNDLRNKRSARLLASQKREKQFEKLNALHPEYKHYYQMSKCYGEMMDYQQDSATSELYRRPRLFVRGEELQEYMNGSTIAGILLVSVEGSHVVGKRGLAVANGNSIEWWMHRGEYTGIIGEQEPPQPNENGDAVNPQPPPPPPPRKRKHDGQLELEFKFMGHQGIITALSLSYDQFFLLSAATDNVIKLWCLRSKMLLTQYKGHSCAIWSVNFSPSGYFFLSSGGDKTIRMWRTDSPIPVRMLVGHQSDVYKADFMKNPDYVISCSGDRSIRIWEIDTADCIRTIYFDRQVLNFTISFSGRFLVSCETNGSMTLIDILNGHEVNSFNLSFLKRNKEQQQGVLTHPIHDLDFSPDEKQFACITKKEVAIYSLETMKEKLAVNVYDTMRDENSKITEEKEHFLRPKEVLDLGTELNLIYCRYHAKNQLVVAGKK